MLHCDISNTQMMIVTNVTVHRQCTVHTRIHESFFFVTLTQTHTKCEPHLKTRTQNFRSDLPWEIAMISQEQRSPFFFFFFLSVSENCTPCKFFANTVKRKKYDTVAIYKSIYHDSFLLISNSFNIFDSRCVLYHFMFQHFVRCSIVQRSMPFVIASAGNWNCVVEFDFLPGFTCIKFLCFNILRFPHLCAGFGGDFFFLCQAYRWFGNTRGENVTRNGQITEQRDRTDPRR